MRQKGCTFQRLTVYTCVGIPCRQVRGGFAISPTVCNRVWHSKLLQSSKRKSHIVPSDALSLAGEGRPFGLNYKRNPLVLHWRVSYRSDLFNRRLLPRVDIKF